MAVRREVFLGVGGFREGAWPDVDLCVRLAARGFRSVWTPHARLAYRMGAAQPSPSRKKREGFEMRFEDPYANPNLVVRCGNYDLRNAVWGRCPQQGTGAESPALLAYPERPTQ